MTCLTYLLLSFLLSPMASLRKKPNSKFWFACFRGPDGRQLQRSTKVTSRKQALALANEWESLSAERLSARQAHKVIAGIYRAANGQDLPNSSTRAYFSSWLARRQGEVAPSSYAAYSGKAKEFLQWLGAQADRPLFELEVTTFTAYRDHLAARRSPATVNHAIGILRGILEDARRDGLVPENPVRDCRKLKAKASSHRRAFTIDEVTRVMEVADAEWRSLIAFGLYTGQRLGDLARLTWANIDSTASEIHLRTSKTGRVVRVPICEPLQRQLGQLPGSESPASPLHPRAFEIRNVSTLSRQFGELLALAGLRRQAASHQGTGKGRDARRERNELSFHSLRHTATSLMKNAGISPAVVQDIIGHESAEVSNQYTHIDSSTKRTALDTLPDVLAPTARN